MSFLFQCPVCRSVREANDNIYGKRVRCADCENFVVVDDSTVVQPSANPSQTFASEEAAPSDAPNPMPVATPIDPQVATPNAAPMEANAGGEEIIDIPADAVVTPPTADSTPAQNPYQVDDSMGDDGDNEGGGWDEGGFEELDLPKGEDRVDDEMDMTPMVDVTFLLLIFFMVTASFVLQKSMDLPTKTQDEPSPNVIEDFEDNEEYVSVFVSPYNEYRVRTSEYDWEDAPNRHELAVRLRDALEAQSRPEKLLIMAHADCMHDKVIQAMDIGIELQYQIQVIMTEEEF